ncbi:MAG: sporulation initiation factor Spo0A C-terminal domain-containing protein [Dorea sp.]|nr:sporulation initiation factor Spo0A C-terminal domain-containing protein [Dorea sp.]
MNNRYNYRELTEKDIRIMKEIVHTLRKLGITENLDGFEYLKEAIFMAVKDPSILNQVTKELYPELAMKFGKTPDSVEHSMRYAIDKGWKTSNVDYIYEIFCFTVQTFAKPSIKYFIKNIASEIRLSYGMR